MLAGAGGHSPEVEAVFEHRMMITSYWVDVVSGPAGREDIQSPAGWEISTGVQS